MPTKMVPRPATAGSASTTSTRRRVIALGVVVALCAAGAVAFAVHATSGRATGRSAAPATPTLATGQLRTLEARPFLVFRSTGLDRDFGRVGLVPAARPASARLLTGLRCDRVDYAAGHGICLTRGLAGILTTTRAVMFGASMRPTASATLAGYPSRARVSPDGSLGATTTFVAGDSYSTMGRFSTRTAILDTTTGKVLLRLEDLQVTRNGQPFRRTDFNFWGVTFERDDRHFYATLGTGGGTFLIRGDLRTSTAAVVVADVECPSLSPDGTRIAFKQRIPGHTVAWRVAVLDLATLQRHDLADPRHVDDQVAWLDNDTVIYGLAQSRRQLRQLETADNGVSALVTGGSVATDTWASSAEGSGSPRRLLAGAWSAHYVGP